MKSILVSSLVLLIAIYTIGSNSAAILSPKIPEILCQNDGINSVESVGVSADGKEYFRELNNTLRTWQEARKSCAGFKLEQATVTTRVQGDFLRKAYSEGKLSAVYYWTSAREQRNQNMLTWDLSSSKLDLSAFNSVGSPPSEGSIPFQVCGEISVYRNTLYFTKCSDKSRVLCQKP